MNLTPQTTVHLFMLVIYIIILYIYDRARVKFKGGNIEMVIILIIINTLLLLAADYTYILELFLHSDVVSVVRTLLRLAAMCAIAFGGLRLITP
ncbi:hypothetical protein ES703_88490 [subsurface metagenome]|jgi:hypothetical protein|uniref:Uncharacterized protein n=1 Tax=Aerophobetes bacterium TaxID=2030807 RepID=A0A523W2M9_UNCAE|nr:MAG: hypothetical protein E3J48_05740 [Candidatus Aerophobetes bacterium]